MVLSVLCILNVRMVTVLMIFAGLPKLIVEIRYVMQEKHARFVPATAEDAKSPKNQICHFVFQQQSAKVVTVCMENVFHLL